MKKITEKNLLARMIIYIAQLHRTIEQVAAGHGTRFAEVNKLGTRFDELVMEWRAVCEAEGWQDLIGGQGCRVTQAERGEEHPPV